MQSKKLIVAAFLLFVRSSLLASVPSGEYADIVDQMNKLQKTYPQFASVYSLGQNDDGVDIYAMRISFTPQKIDPDKIGEILIATHHGNEQYAASFALQFIQTLLSRFSSSEIFRGTLTQQEWTIVPVLNVSGYNANDRYEHEIDPNRDYPGPCITSSGGTLKSVGLILSLLSQRIYAASVTVHGYIGTLSYPWGVNTTEVRSLDDSEYSTIVGHAAQLNEYNYGTSTTLVYACDGTYEDFVYWKYGIWSMLVELRDGSDTDITNTVDAVNDFYDEVNSSPSTNNQMTGQCSGPKFDPAQE